MPLPKIDMPVFELEIPSTNEKVKFRSFTVKEEKILLIAQESKDSEQIINAITQIINNCVFDCNINKLALFDIQYILLTLRSKSVDNFVEFKIEDPETKEEVELKLDLSDVKVQKSDTHSNKIKINDEYTLFLRYPGFRAFQDMVQEDEISAEKSFELMVSCLDKLVSEDDVYKFDDFTKKEVDDFVESLEGDVLKKLKEFFDTMPTIRHEIEYTNSKGNQKTFILEGTETFFI